MYSEPLEAEMARHLVENPIVPVCWYLLSLAALIFVVFCGLGLGEWSRRSRRATVHPPKPLW